MIFSLLFSLALLPHSPESRELSKLFFSFNWWKNEENFPFYCSSFSLDFSFLRSLTSSAYFTLLNDSKVKEISIVRMEFDDFFFSLCFVSAKTLPFSQVLNLLPPTRYFIVLFLSSRARIFGENKNRQALEASGSRSKCRREQFFNCTRISDAPLCCLFDTRQSPMVWGR